VCNAPGHQLTAASPRIEPTVRQRLEILRRTSEYSASRTRRGIIARGLLSSDCRDSTAGPPESWAQCRLSAAPQRRRQKLRSPRRRSLSQPARDRRVRRAARLLPGLVNQSEREGGHCRTSGSASFKSATTGRTPSSQAQRAPQGWQRRRLRPSLSDMNSIKLSAGGGWSDDDDGCRPRALSSAGGGGVAVACGVGVGS